jgi:hypothetical protein
MRNMKDELMQARVVKSRATHKDKPNNKWEDWGLCPLNIINVKTHDQKHSENKPRMDPFSEQKT